MIHMNTALTRNARILARIRLSKPSHRGIHSEKRAMHNAAISTSVPWAKLKTPDALNIRTNPRATSEYSIPVIRPLKNVSRKNPIVDPRISGLRRDRRESIGRASGRERVGQYGENAGVPVSIKKKKQKR